MNPVRRHFKMNLPAFVLCAAKELGVPVQAVQAVTWYIWKYTGKTAPLEAPTGVYDVSQFVNAQPANDISLDEIDKKNLKSWVILCLLFPSMMTLQ
jgi:hypothetical protein